MVLLVERGRGATGAPGRLPMTVTETTTVRTTRSAVPDPAPLSATLAVGPSLETAIFVLESADLWHLADKVRIVLVEYREAVA